MIGINITVNKSSKTSIPLELMVLLYLNNKKVITKPDNIDNRNNIAVKYPLLSENKFFSNPKIGRIKQITYHYSKWMRS